MDAMGQTEEKKLNCWEFKKCGRGLIDGKPCDKTTQCPAATETRLDRVHDGTNSGRACWVVAGTLCGGKAQGSFASKSAQCQQCDFYQHVSREEGGNRQSNVSLLARLKEPAKSVDLTRKKFGILIGGSGLIGGELMYYFKKQKGDEVEMLSPNSKKLSLREPEDIKEYFKKYRPDFIINCAIASLDSDGQLSYEVNYLGTINLAKVAMALKIPFIHFSSAATLPDGENLTEKDTLPLSAKMTNYAKSKLMAEKTLEHLHKTRGLDYTVIKLGVVYGKHDHKIQGFHKMLFTIARKAMLFMLTAKGARHSYTCTKKIPPFVAHVLENREEFSGQAYHFVDHEPVRLSELILTIKSALGIKIPREIYVSYPVAKFGTGILKYFVTALNKVGIEARLPAEMMFMKNFYNTQTLSVEKLKNSSYGLPDPEISVYTELPDIIDYYIARWEHFNLISSSYKVCFFDPLKQVEKFSKDPARLLDEIHSEKIPALADFEELREISPTEN